MLRLFFLFSTLFGFWIQATITASVIPVGPFSSNYQQWIDPTNQFIDYFTVGNSEQARVVFIGSSAYEQTNSQDPDDNGARPTVSEGMGYGLLLAYANNDQTTFDKFLRYVLAVANTQGCAVFTGTQCLSPCPFLMPWIVNQQGQPFWYLPNSTSTVSYYSSGSATDADIQIAWAIERAANNVSQGLWQNSTFDTVMGTLTYQQIFEEMALQIRLNDIGLNTWLYTPGNQWGKAGKKVLYPGYFTPQALVALNEAPIPNISTECPNPYPTISPLNSLQLVFKNNGTKTVSIDYLGGTGDLQVDANFVPKSDVSNGYTVAALAEATAIFTNGDSNYANATIQATHYDRKGSPTITSRYFIEYKNNVWAVTDQGSTSKASQYCQSQVGNVVYVFLTQPTSKKITFNFNDVLSSSLDVIEKYQNTYLSVYENSLLPNVIYYNNQFPDDNFSYIFGYDSCRFALWGSGFLLSNPTNSNNPNITTVIENLLSSTTGLNQPNTFIMNSTLPTGGIDILNREALGDCSSPAIPLNACIMTAAAILGNQSLYDQLSPSVLNYQIVNNQPSSNDPVGDSSPYYNAVMVLLAEAILNQTL